MSWILSALDHWADLTKVQEGLRAGASRWRVEGAVAPVRALIAAWLARGANSPVLLISPTGDSAQRVQEDILALAGEKRQGTYEAPVLPLPSLEVLLYEDISPDPALIGERLGALARLAGGEPGIYVASAPAVFQRTLPPEALRAACFCLRAGEAVNREELVLHLVELGYERQEMVEAPGEISVRGGIVDVHPAGGVWPVRIELFGDDVESLRTFDPSSQRSLNDIDEVPILPARELLLTEEAIGRALPAIEEALAQQSEDLRSQGKAVEAERLEERIGEIAQALRQRAYVSGLEYFLPFLYPGSATALDYLPADGLVIVEEPGRLAEHYVEFHQDLLEIEASRLDHGLLLPTPEPLHLSLESAQGALDGRRVVELCLIGSGPERRPARHVSISSQTAGEYVGDMERLADELRRWQRDSARVLVATRQAERLLEVLAEAGIGGLAQEAPELQPRAGQVVLSGRPLSEGFVLPGAGLVALTDREILGWRKMRRPVRRRAVKGAPISSLTDLEPGDYVVHINHGIGIYHGLVRRGAQGAEREYLLVAYAGEDRLYVPVDQFDRVQKYLGGEEERPQIHRLGGSEWERAKRRARRSARELAGELVRLYAARHNAVGHAFSGDTPWQREMEDGFPYEETPDQLAAIEDVKRDMEVSRPMDRLVCGDVGYGKTEVAIRAAFKTVLDGKQAAILVPTTVLAQQHYATFRERLAPYPVRVEMLSRFRSRKEQEKAVSDLAAGAVDIVVGTHRLLSKDIRFKGLGLVVIDEEQRFGVRHKEKLKQLRTTVDVITMTATPIPRTLHMALSGIRDMSLMNDPPEGRTAIITRAVERDDHIVREAILRELERGGQVYLVHNRVESIGHVADHVRRLVPQARVVVAHGQMNERELERAMLEFYAGDAQILVCTTIIENGLDIPNANTLVVTDADRLGLAQLYQLRGRVGRSDRQAYAYLMWTPFKRLTESAEKRIAAIREFSDLGSGYRIALRDLEIRGAGNLLGPEQHGFVASVGFELYMQMLADAVDEARGEAPAERPQVSIDLPIDAYLPEEYAPHLNQRIDLYRRLANAPDDAHLDELEVEVADRFGKPLPPAARNLVRLARLKVRCAAAGVESMAMEGNLAALRLTEDRRLAPTLAHRLRQALSARVRIWLALVAHDRVVVSLRKADDEEAFTRLEEVLDQLARLPLQREARRHRRQLEVAAGALGGSDAQSG